ncbi:hypothetical protein ABID74_003175 [Gordonia terrae]
MGEIVEGSIAQAIASLLSGSADPEVPEVPEDPS